jgi:hypothetical protein
MNESENVCGFAICGFERKVCLPISVSLSVNEANLGSPKVYVSNFSNLRGDCCRRIKVNNFILFITGTEYFVITS